MKTLVIISCLLVCSTSFAKLDLVIKKPDGKNYWVESFNTRTELDKWLDAEKAKEYWDKRYTWTISGSETVPMPLPTPDPVKEAKRSDLVSKAKQGKLTPQEIQDALAVLLDK